MSVLPSEPDDVLERDPFGAEVALRAPEPLAAFNRARRSCRPPISTSRVTLCALAGVARTPGSVLLASALAVRAPRLGHVLVDLETISRTVAVENEELPIPTLPWPEPSDWVRRSSAATALVAAARTIDHRAPAAAAARLAAVPRPLLARGARSWRGALTALAATPLREPVELADLAAAVARLFPTTTAICCSAWPPTSAVLRGLTVIAGGPGTGKTTTVARIAALLAELAASRGVAAPADRAVRSDRQGGRAAQEAVHDEADRLPVDRAVRDQLLELQASTIHRLLPGATARASATTPATACPTTS